MIVRAFLCIAAATLLPIVATEARALPRPNVVVILADDLGYADLGVQGATDIPTPNIDALAHGGARCTSGYVSGPYCSPTRAALLTGRYQQRFGHEFNPAKLRDGGTGQGLAVGEVTVAERLRQAGYATGIVGKWHLGEEEKFHPQKRGFQEFFGFLTGAHSFVNAVDPKNGSIVRGREAVPLSGHLTDAFADEAVAFIDRHRAKPFFLYLAFNAVHQPLQPPPHLVEKFASIADRRRRLYAALTSSMDSAVGTVLGKLRSAGLEERTLIFFLSDNGGPILKFADNASRNTPLRGSKGDTWEGGVRVPFFVQWKGRIPAGSTYQHPVIQLDIAATALATAGVPSKREWKLDGVDLIPFLTGKKRTPPHEALYWRFEEQMAIRQGSWKLVRADRSPDKRFGDVAPVPMLFDLANDIGESKDLASVQPARTKQMMAVWQKWNATLVAPTWPDLERPLPPGN